MQWLQRESDGAGRVGELLRRMKQWTKSEMILTQSGSYSTRKEGKVDKWWTSGISSLIKDEMKNRVKYYSSILTTVKY